MATALLLSPKWWWALYPDLAEEAFAAVDTSGDSLVTRRNSQPLSKLA
jgi:hypothetical protein